MIEWPHQHFLPTVESLVVPPVCEWIDLDEAKRTLRFLTDSEDTLIDTWIIAARQHFELQTGVQVLGATWEFGLPSAPREAIIELPHPPLLEVLSVVYDDADGAEQTVDPGSYRVVAPAGPTAGRGTVTVPTGGSWPTTSGVSNSLRVRFRAGFGEAPGAIPPLVVATMKLLLGHFHKFRAEVHEVDPGRSLAPLPLGAEAIMRTFKFRAKSQHVMTQAA